MVVVTEQTQESMPQQVPLTPVAVAAVQRLDQTLFIIRVPQVVPVSSSSATPTVLLLQFLPV
jgi:hypothetical protein